MTEYGFEVTYQRSDQPLGLDQQIFNMVCSSEVGYDSTTPFTGFSNAPHHTTISAHQFLAPLVLTKGKFTHIFWLQMCTLYVTNLEFRTFCAIHLQKEYVTSNDAKALKLWFKQKVRSGYPMDDEINARLSDDNFKAFKQAKFMLLAIHFRTYLYYQNQGN